jgi:hypothetical protein
LKVQQAEPEKEKSLFEMLVLTVSFLRQTQRLPQLLGHVKSISNFVNNCWDGTSDLGRALQMQSADSFGPMVNVEKCFSQFHFGEVDQAVTNNHGFS